MPPLSFTAGWRRRCLGLLLFIASVGVGWCWWASGIPVPRAVMSAFTGHAGAGGTLTPYGFFVARESRVDIYDIPTGNSHTVGPLSIRRTPSSDVAEWEMPPIRVVALSANGRVATLDPDGWVRLWDKESGKELASLAPGGGQARSLILAPDGSKVVVITRRTELDFQAILADFRKGSLGKQVYAGGPPLYCMYRYAAKLWDTNTGKVQFVPTRGKLICEEASSQATFSPDVRTLALFTDSSAQLRDVATGRTRDLQDGLSAVDYQSSFLDRRLHFSPDGKLFAATNATGVTRIWDLAKDQPITRYMAHSDGEDTYLYGGSFAIGNRFVAQAYTYIDHRLDRRFSSGPSWLPGWVKDFAGPHVFPSYHAVQVFDLTTGRQQRGVLRLRQFDPNQTLQSCQAAFLPDGVTLATYDPGADCLQLWDVPPRRFLPPFVAWLAGASVLGLTLVWWFAGRARIDRGVRAV